MEKIEQTLECIRGTLDAFEHKIPYIEPASSRRAGRIGGCPICKNFDSNGSFLIHTNIE